MEEDLTWASHPWGRPEADCGTIEGALGWESSPWVLDPVLCSTAWSWASQSPTVGLSIRTFGFPAGSDGKESACNAGDLSSVPGLGRSPGGGNCNPLQYSCLGNPMERGAWWATGHGVTRSQTRLSDEAWTHTHPQGEGAGTLALGTESCS